jgi:hypothetical protein
MAHPVETFQPQTTDTTSGTVASKLADEAHSSMGLTRRKPGNTGAEPETLDFSTGNIYGYEEALSPADNTEQHGNRPKELEQPAPSNSIPGLPEGWKQFDCNDEQTVLQSPDGTDVKLPKGATDVKVDDGKISYLNGGVRVENDKKGEPVAYRSNGFSFEYHSDVDKWFYHQDSGGDYVQIDVPKVTPDGSIHTREHGGFNSGREHHLVSSGQVTESFLNNKQDQMRRYGWNDGYVEGPVLGYVDGLKPTVVNAVADSGQIIGGGADDVSDLNSSYKRATGEANVIDHPKNLEEMVNKLLESGEPLGNVIIETHGSPGAFYIGDNAYRLDDPAVIEQFSQLKGHMADGARIIFGGCQIGHGADAQGQLQGIANATGADVQAFSWVQMPAIPGYGPNIVAKPWPTNS